MEYHSFSKEKLIELLNLRDQELELAKEKSSDNALRSGEERFRAISENSFNSICILNISGQIIWANSACEQLSGYSLAQMYAANSFADFLAPESIEFVVSNFGNFAFGNEYIHSYTFSIIRADGEKRLCEKNMSDYVDKNGERHLIINMIDITNQFKAQEELIASERRYRNIFENVQDIYFETNLDGNILEMTPSIRVMSKGMYTRESLIGTSVGHLYSNPEQREKFIEQLKKYGRVNDFEVTFRVKNNEIRQLSATAVLSFNSEGRPEKIYGTMRDITERKQAEMELRKFRTIADQANYANVIVDLNGLVLYANNEVAEKMGYQVEDIIGKPLNIFFNEEQLPAAIANLGEIATKGGYKTKEVYQTKRDGSIFPSLMNATLVKDEYGNPQFISITAIDITKLKINEEKINELNATLEDRIKLRTHQLSEANNELLKRTEELENFFNLSLDLLCIGDLEGNLLKVSKSWETMLGYPIDEIENSNFFKFIHPDDIGKTLDGLKEINDNPGIANFLINRHVTKSGVSKYIEWQTYPVGNFVYAAGRDITERIKTEQFEQELLKLTPQLTGIPFPEINNAIDKALQRIGNLLHADRSYIFELNPMKETWSNTFEWCAEGIEPQIEYLQDYSMDESPEFAKALANLEDIVIPSVTDMPESMKAERDILEPQGIKSLLIVPITNENNLIGFIGLDSVENYRMFSKNEINTLRVFGNMLASLINHRKQEEIIEQTRINYETFFNTIDDFLIIASENGVIIDSNNTVLNRLGYSKDEISGQNIVKGYPEESHAELLEMSVKNREGIIDSFSIPVKTKNGELIPVETRLKNGLWNGKPAVFCVSKDISAIQLSEQKFSGAFHSNAAIMAITTVADGIYIDVNNAFLDTLGYAIDEVIGKTESEINLCQDPVLRQQITENIQNNISVKDVEMHLATQDGRQLTGLFSADFIVIGTESCLLITIIDITERKKMEAEILRAKNEAEKANHAKSQFLSRMSHELRTPMNSILGFAQLLGMGELNQKQRKGVNHILNNGKHLLDLINEVLDISGIEAGKKTFLLEPIALASLINEITDSLQGVASKRSVTISFFAENSDKHIVVADRIRLKQILINLVGNAIKYNRENGTVTIKTAVQSVGEKENRRIRVSVTDTGPGIRQADAEKLFQPFERIGADKTAIEGTGLGLMLVKKLTEAMGGKVGINSEVGAGSTFWIELPLYLGSGPVSETGKLQNHPQLEPLRLKSTILYVEDNLPNIELVEHILTNHCPGVQLVTTTRGLQTLALTKEHKPALILLDLDLPDIQGFEVLNQLQADPATQHVPVVVVSADAMPFQVEKLLKAGAKDYVTKPLDVPRFMKIIDQYLLI